MIYGKIARYLTPVLAVATIGLGIWGYQQNQERNNLLIKAENQYQRAFHDLAFHIDQLQDELGKTMAINSRRQIDGTLSNVWRISSLARADVGQLPLSLMPFRKTEEFLANIGDFSYKAAIRDLDKEPLSEKEYEQLKSFHQQSIKIQNELRKAQEKVLSQQLRWTDVELALASAETSGNQADNSIIDGFMTINKTVDEYSDLDFGPGVNAMEMEQRKKPENLKGKPITAEQAKQIAMKFAGANEQDAEVKVEKTGKGNAYEAYSVTIRSRGQDGNETNLDVTTKGGHVAWLLNNREVRQANLNLRQAKERADQFLKAHRLENMEAIVQEQYDNVATFSYVYTENGVRVYPDLITLQVAMDTGDVIGYHAEDYLFNHKDDRQLGEPKLSKEEARKEVNPNLRVEEVRLAIALNDQNKETLCYEFMGRLGEDVYRVFINADTGEEEAIEKLDEIGQAQT